MTPTVSRPPLPIARSPLLTRINMDSQDVAGLGWESDFAMFAALLARI